MTEVLYRRLILCEIDPHCKKGVGLQVEVFHEIKQLQLKISKKNCKWYNKVFGISIKSLFLLECTKL